MQLSNSVVIASIEKDTLFVRHLNSFFRCMGRSLSKCPWVFLFVTTTVTLAMATAIPLTKMTNDVSDFTPYAARARSELEIYEEFFSSEGEPIVVFIMVTPKDGGTMLGIRQLNETIRILDAVTNGIYLHNSATNVSSSFAQFCTSFCTINEPVRHFYRAMLVNSTFNESTSSIDLGYPSTTVLGRKFHMDTNFFGVRVEVVKENGKNEIISLDQIRAINGHSILDNEQAQVLNNVRDVRMVVLQLRAQKPAGAVREDVEHYEIEVVDFIKRKFTSSLVNVVVMTPSFLKSEIVRAGLLLAPFSLFGFLIMCVFSSTTATISAVFMSQMDAGKIVLAIAACVCPFMACGTALGALFWMGVRFGSILCVTPFLVLAIGVDDAFLMINSWQRNNRRLKLFPERDQQGQPKVTGVSKRIGAMFEDIGPSVTITTFTNVLAFGIGALTPTPEIRLFCIGNATAMIVDLIYQITFFGSVMAIITGHEVKKEKKALLEKTVDNNRSKPFGHIIRKTLRSGMDKYCTVICNKCVSVLIIGLLAVYWSISIYGTIMMKAELRPEQLFSRDSDLITVLQHRDDYIMPYYSLCYVFVTRPGNISDPTNLRKLHELVEDFENLPRSLGRFSTKFWLRDYESFVESAESTVDEEGSEYANGTMIETNVGKANELLKFLEWPEFHFWKGFVHYHINERDEVVLDKFFFTTASHGLELKEWSQRATLMQQWRSVADKYPDLGVNVYEDDAKFLDLIGTMATQTIQSSVCTLICMVLVCLLFINRISAVLIATSSIVSTCIGVFGILSLWNVDLDPIVMSAVIMSIGFSVDIPAHVTYHFYKTCGETVEARLQNCLSAITFPVLQAALSTLLCVLSLLFVPIHMSVVFVKTMVLVVVIGLIHGLVIIPVFFNVTSWLSISRVLVAPTKNANLGADVFLDDTVVSKN